MKMASSRLLQRMPMNFSGLISTGLLFLIAVTTDAQSPKSPREDRPQVEEIYIARSVPESQTAPTQFCASIRTGFANVMSERKYSFQSLSVSTSDGRLLNPNIKTIGSFHGCFGPTPNPMIFKVFAEVRIGSTTVTGKGECGYGKPDFPERGLKEAHCFLDLSPPDDRYVGGLLTTNSITSLQNVGLETDPPGYTQASIATIRLWKKHSQR
jgi:hypothetical protein